MVFQYLLCIGIPPAFCVGMKFCIATTDGVLHIHKTSRIFPKQIKNYTVNEKNKNSKEEEIDETLIYIHLFF